MLAGFVGAFVVASFSGDEEDDGVEEGTNFTVVNGKFTVVVIVEDKNVVDVGNPVVLFGILVRADEGDFVVVIETGAFDVLF